MTDPVPWPLPYPRSSRSLRGGPRRVLGSWTAQSQAGWCAALLVACGQHTGCPVLMWFSWLHVDSGHPDGFREGGEARGCLALRGRQEAPRPRGTRGCRAVWVGRSTASWSAHTLGPCVDPSLLAGSVWKSLQASPGRPHLAVCGQRSPRPLTGPISATLVEGGGLPLPRPAPSSQPLPHALPAPRCGLLSGWTGLFCTVSPLRQDFDAHFSDPVGWGGVTGKGLCVPHPAEGQGPWGRGGWRGSTSRPLPGRMSFLACWVLN